MELPKVSRVFAIVAAILVLGLGSVIVAIFNEGIAWSQVIRGQFHSAPAPTTVPALSGAALVTVGYLRAHLGR